MRSATANLHRPTQAGSSFDLLTRILRYHTYREGRYSLPNDEIEQQREELMHILVMDILDQQLYLAPMAEPPMKVMDLATGIGLWAIESNQRCPWHRRNRSSTNGDGFSGRSIPGCQYPRR